MNGFYNYVEEGINKDLLNPDYIYFGEWLKPHKIKYKEEHLNKFYLFDVYDKVTEKYLDYEIVLEESNKLNLLMAPVFYMGPFISIEHINSYLGKSELSIDGEGEGIVVKNINYKDNFGNQIFVKLVTDKFKEIKSIKTKKESLNSFEPLNEFVENVVTENRIEKIIMKLQEDDKLHKELDISDMGIILKSIGNQVVEDVMKEEFDELQKIINKKIAKKVPTVVKEYLNKKNNEN